MFRERRDSREGAALRDCGSVAGYLGPSYGTTVLETFAEKEPVGTDRDKVVTAVEHTTGQSQIGPAFIRRLKTGQPKDQRGDQAMAPRSDPKLPRFILSDERDNLLEPALHRGSPQLQAECLHDIPALM